MCLKCKMVSRGIKGGVFNLEEVGDYVKIYEIRCNKFQLLPKKDK